MGDQKGLPEDWDISAEDSNFSQSKLEQMGDQKGLPENWDISAEDLNISAEELAKVIDDLLIELAANPNMMDPNSDSIFDPLDNSDEVIWDDGEFETEEKQMQSSNSSEEDQMDTTTDEPLNRKEFIIREIRTQRYRAPLLFEFLILLLQKDRFRRLASYTNRMEGIFEIHEPDEVAQLWEQVKSRQSHRPMNYDKFARAIRWYYPRNIMDKTNTKYTFKFSKKTIDYYTRDEHNNRISNIPFINQS